MVNGINHSYFFINHFYPLIHHSCFFIIHFWLAQALRLPTG